MYLRPKPESFGLEFESAFRRWKAHIGLPVKLG